MTAPAYLEPIWPPSRCGWQGRDGAHCTNSPTMTLFDGERHTAIDRFCYGHADRARSEYNRKAGAVFSVIGGTA